MEGHCSTGQSKEWAVVPMKKKKKKKRSALVVGNNGGILSLFHSHTQARTHAHAHMHTRTNCLTQPTSLIKTLPSVAILDTSDECDFSGIY